MPRTVHGQRAPQPKYGPCRFAQQGHFLCAACRALVAVQLQVLQAKTWGAQAYNCKLKEPFAHINALGMPDAPTEGLVLKT